jgi:predicted kinase
MMETLYEIKMLILIRGLPGSGKSTLAKSMQGFHHYEADMFFMRNGGYKFDRDQIKQAHEWCQKKTDDSLSIGGDVVVSNTFTQKWEMKPYMEIAKKHGVPVEVITATGNFKNIHGVPEEAIQRMRDRWED